MTDQRAALQSAFLAAAGWGQARPSFLAGDASDRRYTRLHRDNGERAILMDADPTRDTSTPAFVRIAEYLTACGLSAPVILAQDMPNGFLLLEDLGDDLFADLCDQNPDQELPLYLAAADTLRALQTHAPETSLPLATPQYLSGIIDLAFDPYASAFGSAVDAATVTKATDLMHRALSDHAPDTNVTILRDFHAQNLLWLPDRNGVRQVGLLDFQDALCGHPLYDLVSLLQDARRDVSPAVERAVLDHQISEMGWNRDDSDAAYAVLGAQRNLRILGVFARLAQTRGKPAYIDLMPRVWDHLQRDLADPVLHELSAVLHPVLPAPTQSARDAFKRQCNGS